MKRTWLIWLPLAVGVGIFALFYAGLKNPSDRIIASKLIGKDLPEFSAAPAIPGYPGTKRSDFTDGKPKLLNIFASWCVPCAAESPMLLRLQQNGVSIAGVAVHDSAPNLSRFLGENGNPFDRIGLDEAGRAQMEFGSAGVPETFVVDGKGKIIHQHVGVITEDDMSTLLALLKEAE